jgi:hypothetical protein
VELASTLRENLTFDAVGLGSALDFRVLRSIVTEVDGVCGANATYAHAGFASGMLSSVVGNLSTALTATRTSMMEGSTHVEHGKERDVTFEDAAHRAFKYSEGWDVYAPMQLESSHGNTHRRSAVSRWQYNKKAGEKFPWVDLKALHHPNAVGFRVRQNPFAQGVERIVYVFHIRI